MQDRKTVQIILDSVERYTIVIDRCLPVADRELAMLTINHLLRTRQISQWVHVSGLRYWTTRSPRPLADQSLVRTLGVLLFCHSSQSRSLVTRTEIEAYFPDLFRHGLPGGHYVDRSLPSTRLGHVRVDSGQSKVSRIVSRTARLADKYRKQSGFRELIDSGRFEFTWIVPTQSKQRRLIEALHPLSASGLRPRVCAIPELLNVIAPIGTTHVAS